MCKVTVIINLLCLFSPDFCCYGSYLKVSVTILVVQARLYLSPQAVSQYDRTRGPPEHTWRSDWKPGSCSSVPPDLHNMSRKITFQKQQMVQIELTVLAHFVLPSSQENITLVMWMYLCGHNTFLCELLSFTEETVEDGTEVTQQSLAVLQELQGLRVCEVWWAVKQRRTYKTNHRKQQTQIGKRLTESRQHRNCVVWISAWIIYIIKKRIRASKDK